MSDDYKNGEQTDLEVFFEVGGYDAYDVEWFKEQLEYVGIELDENDPDCLDAFYANEDGVYCHWCDGYFADKDEAIEIMKEDERAVEAAFNGHIDFESRPFICNRYDDAQQNMERSDCQKLGAMKGFFVENVQDFKVIVEKEKLDRVIPEPEKKSRPMKI
ncbi:MAG TPA: hypothetical protein VM577_19435 [Anaerovoracaceae bacterium]|nr:hypothetical protein [Anaerovoracaceae bacterium]